jgi:hypothetical protein
LNWRNCLVGELPSSSSQQLRDNLYHERPRRG